MFLRVNTTEFTIACVAVTLAIGTFAGFLLSDDFMYVVWPVIMCCCTFLVFSYVLWKKINSSIFGEVGFIYLGLALAYTVLPAANVLISNFTVPIGNDGSVPLILYPEPAIVGDHFWRHAIFIIGVASGYLLVRGKEPKPLRPIKILTTENNDVIAIMFMILVAAITVVIFFSAPVTTYYEHYTRYEHLPVHLLRLVQFSLLFKSGVYFLLLALMFSQYEKFKWYIFFIVPVFCIFEILFSFGSRIEALTILIGFAGFYHYKVRPLSFKNGFIYLILLGSIFSIV